MKQNPWTAWDPDGLRAADNEYLKKAKELSGPRPIGDTLKGIGYGLIGTLQELNPFSGNSEITHTRQEFSKGVTHALDEIEAAPIPRVMKSVAKFGVGVGTGGDSLNPLNLFTDLTATARTVNEKGVLQVSSNLVDNLVDNIKNHPEAILGQVTTYSSLFNRNVGEIATKGKEGARITFGDPAGKQLSLNAYTNNAQIGPYLPGLGVNLLKAGKRVFGIEYHRFNLKNNGGSVVKLHRHSGPTSSQVSKHRKLLSDETY